MVLALLGGCGICGFPLGPVIEKETVQESGGQLTTQLTCAGERQKRAAAANRCPGKFHTLSRLTLPYSFHTS